MKIQLKLLEARKLFLKMKSDSESGGLTDKEYHRYEKLKTDINKFIGNEQ